MILNTKFSTNLFHHLPKWNASRHLGIPVAAMQWGNVYTINYLVEKSLTLYKHSLSLSLSPSSLRIPDAGGSYEYDSQILPSQKTTNKEKERHVSHEPKS